MFLSKTFRRVASPAAPILRRWNSTESCKPPLKLVAELRKFTDVSISKAREALVASGNDVQQAVEWLDQDLATSGVKKAQKVSDRVAKEGLISVSILSRGAGDPPHHSVRAALVELNCETDFVARTPLFSQLAADVAHTAAFVSEPANASPTPSFQALSLDLLNDAPLLSASGSRGGHSHTVKHSILEIISKVGENITLRRASAMVSNPITHGGIGLRIAGHAHGLSSSQGRIAALALLHLKSPTVLSGLAREGFLGELDRLERALARQVVGFQPLCVKTSPDGTGANGEEGALYNQEFQSFGEENDTVQTVLKKWSEEHGLTSEEPDGGVQVLDFARWTLGRS